jgi:hypothetical protein
VAQDMAQLWVTVKMVISIRLYKRLTFHDQLNASAPWNIF